MLFNRFPKPNQEIRGSRAVFLGTGISNGEPYYEIRIDGINEIVPFEFLDRQGQSLRNYAITHYPK